MARIAEEEVNLLKVMGPVMKAKRRVDFTVWIPAERHANAGQFWTIHQQRIYDALRRQLATKGKSSVFATYRNYFLSVEQGSWDRHGGAYLFSTWIV